MRRIRQARIGFVLLLAASLAGSLTAGQALWSDQAAASYLDSRMDFWIGWQMAARDHDTFCVSCHTVLPYALARPALRTALSESGPSSPERKLLDNVTKRVRMWSEVEPFYPDATRGVPKTAESRGTESILNALILATYESPSSPQAALSSAARQAFDNMWAQQLTTGDDKGAWPWLQFHNAPFEGDSQYYGATLAAIAVGAAPAGYRESSAIQDRLQLLRGYLSRGRDSQTLMNRVMLLWASVRIPGLLTPAERSAIVTEALSKQQPDGGFSLSAFLGPWKRRDNTPLDARSDGLATGLVAFVLTQDSASSHSAQIARAVAWLRSNQEKSDGRWLAYSPNKERDLSTNVGKFMSDAATAYAVLALEQAK